jgi:hypothetical protein
MNIIKVTQDEANQEDFNDFYTRGCSKSHNCDLNRSLNPLIWKLGGECKRLGYFSDIL